MHSKYIVVLAWLVLTAVCFGVWQESVAAGVFLFMFMPTALTIISAIGRVD